MNTTMNPARAETERVHVARMDGLLDHGRGFDLRQTIEADLRQRLPRLSGYMLSGIRDELTVRALASEGLLSA